MYPFCTGTTVTVQRFSMILENLILITQWHCQWAAYTAYLHSNLSLISVVQSERNTTSQKKSLCGEI